MTMSVRETNNSPETKRFLNCREVEQVKSLKESFDKLTIELEKKHHNDMKVLFKLRYPQTE